MPAAAGPAASTHGPSHAASRPPRVPHPTPAQYAKIAHRGLRHPGACRAASARLPSHVASRLPRVHRPTPAWYARTAHRVPRLLGVVPTVPVVPPLHCAWLLNFENYPSLDLFRVLVQVVPGHV